MYVIVIVMQTRFNNRNHRKYVCLQLGNAMVPDRCLFANTRTVASKACISKHCNDIPSNIRFNLKAVQEVMNSKPDK